MRVALIEMLHPDAVPGDEPIPPEGAIEEAVESAKTFCGAEAPGVRQRRARGSPPRGARECRASDEQREHEHLDDLIARLERAAEQLRSGELSPGRGGDDGRGLRGARRRRRRPSSSSSRAPRRRRRPPGQDTLL